MSEPELERSELFVVGQTEPLVLADGSEIPAIEDYSGWLEYVRSADFEPRAVFDPTQHEFESSREVVEARDNFFMGYALQEADKSIARGPNAKGVMDLPIGVAIARGNDLVAVGYTSNKRDQIGHRHAEIVAMEAAAIKVGGENGPNNVLKDCTLYTMVEPCHMCHFTAWEQGLKSIVASISQQELTDLFGHFSRKKKTATTLAEESGHYQIPIKYDVRKDETLQILKQWRPAERGGFRPLHPGETE